jgi:hypothetical protein
MRAAEAGTSPAPEAEDPPASAIKPRARRPATSPKRGGSRKSAATNGHGAGAPVAHYDDLDADEIVTLLDSLEDAGLDALLDYERANRGRPRVVSAIEGTRARREAGQHG